MSNPIPERASEEHERNFRATWVLRREVEDDPYWQAAFEYAAKYKVTLAEMDALGPVLVRLAEFQEAGK